MSEGFDGWEKKKKKKKEGGFFVLDTRPYEVLAVRPSVRCLSDGTHTAKVMLGAMPMFEGFYLMPFCSMLCHAIHTILNALSHRVI